MKSTHIILLTIIAIILFGLFLPNGIAAAIANNLWSVRFIKGAYAQDGVDPQSFSPPDSHKHAGMLLAHQALDQEDVDLALFFLEPRNPTADRLVINSLAQTYYRQGDYTAALEMWKNTKDAGSLNFAGIGLAEMGEIDLAILAYQYAYEVRPSEEIYRMRLVGYLLSEANELVESGQYPEAVNAYQGIITQYPEDGRAYSGLAWAYWRQGMGDQALQAIQDGWVMNNGYFPFFVTAARIFEGSGLTAQALVAYQQVLDLNPRFQEAIDGIERLSGAHD